MNSLITGNVAHVDDIGYTDKGTAALKFVVYEPQRTQNKDGEWVDGKPLKHHITAWGKLAESVYDTLQTGQQVIVTCRAKQEEITTENGWIAHYTTWIAVDIAVSCRFAAWKQVNSPENTGIHNTPHSDPRPAPEPAASQHAWGTTPPAQQPSDQPGTYGYGM